MKEQRWKFVNFQFVIFSFIIFLSFGWVDFVLSAENNFCETSPIEPNNINQAQKNFLDYYEDIINSQKSINERTIAAYCIISILNNGILDYNANFTYKNGFKILDELYRFLIDYKKDDINFVRATYLLFENLYQRSIFEDIAYKANKLILNMNLSGIYSTEQIACPLYEFQINEISSQDKDIMKNSILKVSENLLRTHLENIEKLRLNNKDKNYPFLDDHTREYIYTYLLELGIDTKIVVHHDSYLDTQMRPIKNVIATIQGSFYPKRKIVLSAHYDSKIPPGADDNASGIAVLLEIARIIKENKVPLMYTIEFTFFDYEERDLNGSSAYVRNALINKEEIIAVLNFDQVGWDGGDGKVELLTCEQTKDFLNKRVLYFTKIIGKEDFVIPIVDDIKSLSGSSDHSSFLGVDLDGEYLGRGCFNTVYIAAARKAERENPYYHTDEDTVDKLNLEFLENLTKWAIGVIYGLANPVD